MRRFRIVIGKVRIERGTSAQTAVQWVNAQTGSRVWL